MARILFIGLGNMGLPMAHNLSISGYWLLGIDSNPEQIRLSSQQGFGAVLWGGDSISEFKPDLVITMLPGGPAVQSVATVLYPLLLPLRWGKWHCNCIRQW